MGDSAELLVWLDMEMTGLDPATCVPMEVAVIVTDGQLVEIESAQWLVQTPVNKIEEMDPFVEKMHTDNGLTERVLEAGRPLEEVDHDLVEVIGRRCPDGRAILAGNSIHQDRRFIRRYFPRLEQILHYRMVDVSSIKEIAERWYGKDAGYDKPDSPHTALADTRASIEELRWYRERYFRRRDAVAQDKGE
ncbi:MAG TPA: oligoribonuclease [Deltaproteobacteria bacterium]|nr:oligoribonuclease [Candidatus Binatota bacterium]HIL13537.1 oligoribonuclease [Deltaproteobacteria bacterium]